MVVSAYPFWEVRSYEDHCAAVVVTHGPPLFGDVCASNASVAQHGCYKHTAVVKVCKCLDPAGGGKRIRKLVWQLTGQSFAKLNL